MTSLQCLKPYISIEFRLPSHRYIYTNIKMVPLKLHQSSTWRIQGCVLSIVHSWKVYHLHYEVIVKKYFQHYWPSVRETTGGFPSRRTSDVEHWCSLWCHSEQTFEQTVHEQVIWCVLKLIWRRSNDLWYNLNEYKSWNIYESVTGNSLFPAIPKKR